MYFPGLKVIQTGLKLYFTCLKYSFCTLDRSKIDKIQKELPILNKFIIPGGNKLVSFCHVSRAVCRRAERKITKLSEFTEVDENILTYINRLSDFLFVLARYYTMILDIEESYW